MHLWTEYEGRTVAGAYTLGKLLRSEGRNGFFTTSDTHGKSAVIRLTEAHFDEEEVLKRWRHVAELHGDHLIEIERVGQTDVDGVALTYALMERNDANLEDVLKERPLTAAETTEVAKSIVAALKILHESGLVHEHVEPANILAVGDVVKLRSDCVRECVADGEFTSEEACEALRKRDTADFGTLLLRCLTLEREWSTSHRLPEPFRRIVPAAINGDMSLRQIDSLLNPSAAVTPTAVPNGAGNGAGYAAGNGASPAGTSAAPAGAARSSLVPEGVRIAAAAAVAAERAPGAAVRGLAQSGLDRTGVDRIDAEPAMRLRSYAAEEAHETVRSSTKPLWIAGAVAAVLLLFALLHVFSNSKPGKGAVPAQSSAVGAASVPAAGTQPAQARGPVSSTADGGSAAGQAALPQAASASPVAGTAHGAGWYVIAYTYYRENQAEAKASRVSRRGFHAAVFSPSGHGPYLVSLGGPMSEGEADALLHRARRGGMPRDTFIRRY